MYLWELCQSLAPLKNHARFNVPEVKNQLALLADVLVVPYQNLKSQLLLRVYKNTTSA